MNSQEINPLVSIILTVFNRELVIEKTILSIINQEYTHFELIIIDDYSSDTTFLNIQKFLVDNRVFIFRNESNMGQTKSLLRGISNARGRYIANCDAGDCWDEKKLKAQVEFLDSHPDYIVCGTQVQYVSEEGVQLGTSSFAIDDFEIRKNFFKEKGIFSHPTILFRNIGIYYRSFFYNSQDLDLYMRLSFYGKLYCLSIPLTFVILHDKGVTFGRKYYQRQFQRCAYRLFKERLSYGSDSIDDGTSIKIRNNRFEKLLCDLSMYFYKKYTQNRLSKKSLIIWLSPLIISSIIYYPIMIDYIHKFFGILLMNFQLQKYKSYFLLSHPRIFFISDFVYPLHIGGSSREAYDLLVWSQSRLYIYYLAYRSQSGRYSMIHNKIDIPQVLKGYTIIPISLGLGIIKKIKKIHIFVSESNIIYIHHPLLGFLITFFFISNKKFIIYQFHGPFAEEYFYKSNKRYFGYWIRKKIQIYLLKRANRIIAHSEYMQAKILELDKSVINKIRILPPAIDVSTFDIRYNQEILKKRLNIANDKIVIYINRRITRRTGVIEFVRQFLNVDKSIINNYHLLITGGGESDTELRKIIYEKEDVHYESFVNQDDLPSYYNISNVCVLPSRDLEGFGLVVLEAFASGIPVIVSDKSGGAMEFIKLFDPLLIYKLDDLNSFLSTLQYALETYNVPCYKLREIAKKYTSDLVYPKYLDILSQ